MENSTKSNTQVDVVVPRPHRKSKKQIAAEALALQEAEVARLEQERADAASKAGSAHDPVVTTSAVIAAVVGASVAAPVEPEAVQDDIIAIARANTAAADQLAHSRAVAWIEMLLAPSLSPTLVTMASAEQAITTEAFELSADLIVDGVGVNNIHVEKFSNGARRISAHGIIQCNIKRHEFGPTEEGVMSVTLVMDVDSRTADGVTSIVGEVKRFKAQLQTNPNTATIDCLPVLIGLNKAGAPTTGGVPLKGGVNGKDAKYLFGKASSMAPDAAERAVLGLVRAALLYLPEPVVAKYYSLVDSADERRQLMQDAIPTLQTLIGQCTQALDDAGVGMTYSETATGPVALLSFGALKPRQAQQLFISVGAAARRINTAAWGLHLSLKASAADTALVLRAQE